MQENLTDIALIERLKRDDRQAFTQFYNRYWERLYYKAAKKLNSLEIAEELVQDIFMDIWHRRHRLQITGQPEAYLAVALKYKILREQAKTRLNNKYKEHTAIHSSEIDPATQDWLSFEELRERLARLVSSLPQKCRLAYTLRDEGLSQKEIAEQMSISEKTVNMHITRALRTIRQVDHFSHRHTLLKWLVTKFLNIFPAHPTAIRPTAFIIGLFPI